MDVAQFEKKIHVDFINLFIYSRRYRKLSFDPNDILLRYHDSKSGSVTRGMDLQHVKYEQSNKKNYTDLTDAFLYKNIYPWLVT